VRARGWRDSAGLLGTYIQKLLSEKYVWNFFHMLCVPGSHLVISSFNFSVLIFISLLKVLGDDKIASSIDYIKKNRSIKGVF
jgi:hypothetical protein